MAEFHHIMVPVDLRHRDTMEKALSAAAALARLFNADITLVGASAPTPSEVAHTFDEYRQKLEAFAKDAGTREGVEMAARAVDTPDPSRDLDDALARAVESLGADLIVMASHVPTFADYLLSSNAGQLASHTKASVFIVR